ncbi:dNA replication and repair protein RecF [Firmicutes bacterium CAG:460]|nr:dNA replication and repair protein RecF [Firmicutes bacterium CAG:460]
MKIDSLSLMNFRNYETLNISFGDLNIIYGLNGSGKTNIIEAIYTLALTKSFRINNDKVMIKKGKIKAKIKGNVLKNGDENTFGVEISNDGKVVTINGEKQDKVSDYVSRINVILFNPSDTRLIDEAPSERRKMLNIEISQIYKEYLVILTNYQRILKQRNFYLRGMYVNGSYTNTYLDILTKKLIEYGSIICKYREKFVDNINKYIASNYEKIFGSGTLKIRYVSTFKNKSEDDLIKRYKDNYQKELSVGKTLEGIHHDDIVFVLDNNNLKEWGSEGQRKNAIISFKLAEISVINEIKGFYPILILDDLFSELDKEKVTNLLGMLDRNVQTFMTTTDLKNINKKVIKDAKKFKVNDGILEEE